MQYRQDVRHIAPYHKSKHFPSCTRCSENHNNTCAENRWKGLFLPEKKAANHIEIGLQMPTQSLVEVLRLSHRQR